MSLSERLTRLNDAVFRHHSEAVIYTAAGGSPVALLGIYFKRDVLVDLGESAASSVEHRVDVRAEELPSGPRRGATVEIRGVVYDVTDAQGPDDSGVVKLQLELPD